MATPKSFLPLVDLCDNFSLVENRHALVPFCLMNDPRTVVGLLWPEIVLALAQDNIRYRDHVYEDISPSYIPWIFIDQNGVQVTIDAQVELANDPPGSNASNALPLPPLRLVHFADTLTTHTARTDTLTRLCNYWRTSGQFASLIGGNLWRNEPYAVFADPFRRDPLQLAFEVERAAAALFGVVTYGAHMTMYRPGSTHQLKLGESEPEAKGEEMVIWVPKRSQTKQTWPGYLDNTVAGGIPAGMQPSEVIIKEAMEEASLAEDIVRLHTRPVGVISYFHQKGRWLQPEVEYIYDLRVPPDTSPSELESFIPKPLDGEVESFECLPLSEVISRMHLKLFKPNCAIVLIDFLIRHGMITPESEPNYLEIVSRLHGRFDHPFWSRSM